MFVDSVLVDIDAGRSLGVEQGVEVTAGDVVLQAHVQESVRADDDTKVGDVGIVGVEHPRHGAAAEANGVDDVGGVDVAELGHGRRHR